MTSVMTNHSALNPLLPESPLVFYQGQIYTLGEMLSFVEFLSTHFPAHQYCINLCEERFFFLAGFLLALRENSITLLPSDSNDYTLQKLTDKYQDVILLKDSSDAEHSTKSSIFDLKPYFKQWQQTKTQSRLKESGCHSLAQIKGQQVVVIIFTSGSTGEPKAYEKQWDDLLHVANHLHRHFIADLPADIKTADVSKAELLSQNSLPVIIATVPAQHMYGLDVTIMMALQHGIMIYSGKPFFPQDIKLALEALEPVARQRQLKLCAVLVTTPLHLKACVKTSVELPGVREIISATAPLEAELARSCEQEYGTIVMELFGCTEVGSMAWRRTTEEQTWHVFSDIDLEYAPQGNEVVINTRRSIARFIFNDEVELLDNKNFILKGRKADAVSQAGKRSSLSYLNHHLQNFSGIDDACYFQDTDSQDSRLVAFVVPGQSYCDSYSKEQLHHAISKDIRHYLGQYIDPVFLPRKIYLVPQLPRNATGKLPLKALKQLLREQTR